MIYEPVFIRYQTLTGSQLFTMFYCTKQRQQACACECDCIWANMELVLTNFTCPELWNVLFGLSRSFKLLYHMFKELSILIIIICIVIMNLLIFEVQTEHAEVIMMLMSCNNKL